MRITDLLLEADDAIGFTDAFTHLRASASCKNRVGLLNVLLAEGLNLGLRKMAEASDSHDFFELSRLSRWHIGSETMDQALAMVVEAQVDLPMVGLWGGDHRLQRQPVLPGRAPGRGHEPGLRPLRQRAGPLGLHPPLRQVRLLLDPNHTGHGR